MIDFVSKAEALALSGAATIGSDELEQGEAAKGDGIRRGYIQVRLIAERDQVTRDLYDRAGLPVGGQLSLANDLAHRFPIPRSSEAISHMAFVLNVRPDSVETYIKRAARKLHSIASPQLIAA